MKRDARTLVLLKKNDLTIEIQMWHESHALKHMKVQNRSCFSTRQPQRRPRNPYFRPQASLPRNPTPSTPSVASNPQLTPHSRILPYIYRPSALERGDAATIRQSLRFMKINEESRLQYEIRDEARMPDNCSSLS